jgi:biofilm PGA synthesis N-glycosyltransferase PgaC
VIRPGALLVISPVRDEIATLACTAASVLAQSEPPALWLVVDDGSRDGTWELLQELGPRIPFLRSLRLARPGGREPGPAVVRAFQAGLETADLACDLVGKLDGDVLLPSGYYATIRRAFAEEPRLGIASGSCLAPRGPAWSVHFRPEPQARFHTRGPCKVWRRSCLEAMGGLRPVLGWDGLDGYAARRLGYATRCLPGLEVLHLRPTHSGDGPLRGGMRAGRGAWHMHYHPAYLLARAVLQGGRPPYLLGGLGLLLGFLASALRGEARELPEELRAHIRREQRDRMLRLLRPGRAGEGG